MKKFVMLLLLCVLTASPLLAAAMRLPVISDDFNKASAEAAKRKLPLFVEVWAPW